MVPLIPSFVKSEFIFDQAPTPSCHASTLVESAQGTLLCAWFGGAHEGASDVGIWLSRHIGGVWTIPIEVAIGRDGRGSQIPCWNPVLYQTSPGHLLLFYRVGRNIPHWKGFFKQSTDDGITWSPATALPRGILGPIKDKPITLTNGRILSGSSEELGGWKVHFEYSDDQGAHWRRTKSVNSPGVIGAIQPTLLEQENGAVAAVGRTREGKIFHISSTDWGNHWSRMELLEVNNPNSGIDAVRLRSGQYLMVYNNSASKRTPLNLGESSDGVHWTEVATLEDTPGEFSYPAIIQTSDGLVHATYTWNRVKIKHVVIRLSGD